MSGIVVGVDGSDHSLRALEWAVAEAALRKTPLTVVTVHQVAMDHWGIGELRYPEDDAARDRAGEAAHNAVEKAVAQLSGPKPPSVQVKAASGIPAAVLVSESKDADLLVVGTRGGGFEELMMGSVSIKAAHHAACPVVIVR